jgi:hypothetical protein
VSHSPSFKGLPSLPSQKDSINSCTKYITTAFAIKERNIELMS